MSELSHIYRFLKGQGSEIKRGVLLQLIDLGSLVLDIGLSIPAGLPEAYVPPAKG